MPVLNKYHLPNKQIPHGAIYIGRGSMWGNPYPIGEKYGDRATVLKLYREYLDAQLSADNISKRELAALKGQSLVCYCKPAPCHGDILLEYADKAYAELHPTKTVYSWSRYGGYECSTKGDSRFSAFNARMPDGRTIEEHYQCDIKGYDVGGTNWKLGKGKPPLNPNTDLMAHYTNLWRTWAKSNTQLIQELMQRTKDKPVLSDMFATTPVNQAHALSLVLNEMLATQKETVKLIVAGSRTYQDVLTANIILDQFKDWVESKGKTLEIVSGMATGPDMFGFDYANKKDIPVHKFYADWNGQGKSAGYVRNVAMGNFGDHLIAFWDGQSRGTNHMINYMKGLNKPVTIIKG